MRYYSWPMYLILVVLGFGGCGKSEPEPLKPEVLPTAQDVDTSEAAVGYDISNQEATDWANSWTQAMIDNQSSTIGKLFDWEGLYARVAEPLNLGSRDRQKFEQGMRESNIGSNLSMQIAMVCEASGNYRFVRLVRRDGVLHAVFRLQSQQLGINYHDVRLVRKDSEIVGDRLFVAATGEELADTMKALALPLIKNNAGRGMSAEKKEDQAAFESIIEMLKSARAGDAETTKRLYKSLPTRYQNSKNALLAMIMATSIDENEDEYLIVIDKYSASFPNDPSLGLLLLDAAMMREDWELLESSRRQIQAWTGGDDFMDLLVAAVLAKSGKLELAVELSKGIDPATLAMASAHDYKMVVALANNDHGTVLRQLLILRDDYELDIPSVGTDPDFAGFRDSPEYQQWIAR